MIEIPLTAPVPPRATFSMELAGVPVAFELRWNSATSGWYLDVRTPGGADVILGRRLTVGRPIGWRLVDTRFPVTGWLVVIDTTGAQDDPGFTDLGTRHRLLFVERSDVPRVPVEIRRQLDARAFVPVDGPDSVYVPLIEAHWTVLGIEPPTFQVSTGVASGALTALIGGTDMTANGTGQQYEQTVTGWFNKLVRKPEGQTGDFRWETATEVGSTDDFAALVYMTWDASTISTQSTIIIFPGTGDDWRVDTPNELKNRWDNNQTDLTDRAFDLTQIEPFYWVRDASANLAYYATIEEEGSVAETQGALTGPTRTAISSDSDVMYGPIIAVWAGADATALLDAGYDDASILQALGWTLNF